jgi:hypothetical protein
MQTPPKALMRNTAASLFPDLSVAQPRGADGKQVRM